MDTGEKENYWKLLPNEIVIEIICFTEWMDLQKCYLVCKSWNFLLQEKEEWIHKIFGEKLFKTVISPDNIPEWKGPIKRIYQQWKKSIERMNKWANVEGLANVTMGSQWYLETDYIYQEGMKKFPDSSPLMGNYANFHYNYTKNYSLAEHFYLKAIELKPSNPYPYGNYARFLWIALFKFKEVEPYLLKALELDPFSLEFFFDYIFYLCQVKEDFVEAEKQILLGLEQPHLKERSIATFIEYLLCVEKNPKKALDFFQTDYSNQKILEENPFLHAVILMKLNEIKCDPIHLDTSNTSIHISTEMNISLSNQQSTTSTFNEELNHSISNEELNHFISNEELNNSISNEELNHSISSEINSFQAKKFKIDPFDKIQSLFESALQSQNVMASAYYIQFSKKYNKKPEETKKFIVDKLNDCHDHPFLFMNILEFFLETKDFHSIDHLLNLVAFQNFHHQRDQEIFGISICFYYFHLDNQEKAYQVLGLTQKIWSQNIYFEFITAILNMLSSIKSSNHSTNFLYPLENLLSRLENTTLLPHLYLHLLFFDSQLNNKIKYIQKLKYLISRHLNQNKKLRVFYCSELFLQDPSEQKYFSLLKQNFFQVGPFDLSYLDQWSLWKNTS